jgi:hypothetical protein
MWNVNGVVADQAVPHAVLATPSVQCGAVKQTLDRVGSRTEFRPKAATALGQREGVTLPPQTLQAASALPGALVPGPDAVERELTHERFSERERKTRTAAMLVVEREERRSQYVG